MESSGPLQGGNSTKTRRFKLKQKLKQKTERVTIVIGTVPTRRFRHFVARTRRFSRRKVIILLGFGCLGPGHPSAELLHLGQFLECKSLAPSTVADLCFLKFNGYEMPCFVKFRMCENWSLWRSPCFTVFLAHHGCFFSPRTIPDTLLY
jgi:hypothetical protein